MKKKNRLQMLAALLAATLSMALTSPIAAKANEEYNVDTIKETNAETGRIYYLKNSHGDVIGQMDENGNVLTSYAYNAFGEQVSAVVIQGGPKSTSNRFLYAGEQYDKTSGFYYLRARHYDVKAGRFTQEDTYLGDGRNLYAYVHSNPLKYVDPTGHNAEATPDDKTNLLNDEKVYDGGRESQSSTFGKYQVGAYQNIKGAEGMDAHHVGQKAVMKNLVENYDSKTAPAINVPKVGHTIPGPNGIVSRSTQGIDSARQLLARDLYELKRVYPDIPNSAYQELIDMNMNMYPEMREQR